MLGQRSIYHDGWLASTVHPPLSSWGNFEHDEWELFHLEVDRSQSRNLAAEHPERLQSLRDLWFYNAGIYNGLPLDDRSAIEQVLAERPHGAPGRDRYIFDPNCADVPESAGPAVPGRSYTFNWIGTVQQDVIADEELVPGDRVVVAEFAAEGPNGDPAMPGTAGALTLYVDDRPVGSERIVTQPGYFCLTGDGICVGRDSASAVSRNYQAPFPFVGGEIDKVVFDVSGDKYVDHEGQVRAWFSID